MNAPAGESEAINGHHLCCRKILKHLCITLGRNTSQPREGKIGVCRIMTNFNGAEIEDQTYWNVTNIYYQQTNLEELSWILPIY